MSDKCICGKEGRYARIKGGDISQVSCNKYFSCKTKTVSNLPRVGNEDLVDGEYYLWERESCETILVNKYLGVIVGNNKDWFLDGIAGQFYGPIELGE